MTISFTTFKQNSTFPVSDNNLQRIKLSFKGVNGGDEPSASQGQKPKADSNYASIQIHPLFSLNIQLLKDGYTKDEISEHKVFTNTFIESLSFDSPNLLDDVASGKITKEDIFTDKSKNLEDIQAMQRAYLALKAKFNTSDVQEHVLEQNKFFLEFQEVMKSLGKEDLPQKAYTHRTMILSLLHYLNKNNEPVLQELLNDKSFNNIYLKNALIGIKENNDPAPALRVIKMAQEIGYQKDFSFALAILVSEANEKNLPMIEKMLYEQEFLSENDDFVATKLMNFLRSAGVGLAKDYAEDDTMTLDVVDEVIELGQNFEE